MYIIDEDPSSIDNIGDDEMRLGMRRVVVAGLADIDGANWAAAESVAPA